MSSGCFDHHKQTPPLECISVGKAVFLTHHSSFAALISFILPHLELSNVLEILKPTNGHIYTPTYVSSKAINTFMTLHYLSLVYSVIS